MNVKILLALFLLVLAVAACSGVNSETKKLVQELNTSHAHEGQTVTLKGYLRAAEHGAIVSGGTLSAGLASSAWAASGDVFVKDIRLKFGQEPNAIFMPKKYKREEVEVQDKNGQRIDLNSMVKITGTVRYASTQPIEPPKPPSGPMVMEMQRKSYEKDKAAYEARKAKGDLMDYSYSIVNVSSDFIQE